MKNIFSRLGIRKMDEMEKYLALKSQSYALIYVTIILLAWTFYESYKVYVYHTPINLFPCFLLISTGLVQNFSQLILNKQVTKGDVEFEDPNPILKTVFIMIAVVGIIASLGAWLMISRN